MSEIPPSNKQTIENLIVTNSLSDIPKRFIDPKQRANLLSGKDWLKNSISIWSNLSKTKEEKAFKHPASFPEALVEKLLLSFLSKPCLILDPFMGCGTTLATAGKLNHQSVGFELYDEFIIKAKARVERYGSLCSIIQENAMNLSTYIKPESIDMVITSPPYWNILRRQYSTNYKRARRLGYGENQNDLGNIQSYEEFLSRLMAILKEVYIALKPKSYCIINVMDLRIKDRLYPLHSDLYTQLNTIGFKLDDLIIWDRRHDYNNFQTLGYPYKFRINRAHEYLLIFMK
ncbi:MAG: site-specific DNA-methyltransferase [Holosporales bacterium]|nr:site-specific DNA-methyltransferase [Holosporales bacterium]